MSHNNLDQILKEKNMSRSELAEKTGVPFIVIDAIANDDYKPNLALLNAIAETLQTPARDIFPIAR